MTIEGFKAFIGEHPNLDLIFKVTQHLLEIKKPLDMIHCTVTLNHVKTVGGVTVFRETHPHAIPHDQKVRILMQIMSDLDLSWGNLK